MLGGKILENANELLIINNDKISERKYKGNLSIKKIYIGKDVKKIENIPEKIREKVVEILNR